MFQKLFEKLNFPQESRPVFVDAYRRIMENEKATKAFEITCGSMLHPDNNVFGENAPVIAEATGLHPYTVNMVLQLFCLHERHGEPLHLRYWQVQHPTHPKPYGQPEYNQYRRQP